MRAYFRILSQFSLSLMVVIPLGMLLFPSVTRPHKSPAEQCQSNLKQVALGLFQYVQDYDEKYPITKSNQRGVTGANPWGWADALAPYLTSTTLYHCPENHQYRNKPRPTSAQSWGYTDYFYNSNLSGINQAFIEDVSHTVTTGDGNDGTGGTSARYSLNALPAKWRYDKKSPSYRHNGGAYYGFADGSVAWLKPGIITTRPTSEGHLSFSIK
jgi:prepilin-type processing-associated H-X9-DG protein